MFLKGYIALLTSITSNVWRFQLQAHSILVVTISLLYKMTSQLYD